MGRLYIARQRLNSATAILDTLQNNSMELINYFVLLLSGISGGVSCTLVCSDGNSVLGSDFIRRRRSAVSPGLHVSLPQSSDVPTDFFGLIEGESRTLSDDYLTPSHVRIRSYLILMTMEESSPEHIRKSLEDRINKLKSQPSAWSPEAEFFVVLNMPRGIKNYVTVVHQVINILWEHSVYNSLIEMKLGDGYMTYAADPFDDSNNCGKEVRYVKRLASQDMMAFPNLKRKEFPGCSLKVSWAESPPFSFTDGGVGVSPTGIDVRLVELAASRSRLRVAWHQRPKKIYGKNEGFYEELDSGNIDIAIGGVEILSEYWAKVSYTSLTGMDSLSVYVASYRVLPMWKTLYVMFSPGLWAVVCFTSLASAGLLFLVRCRAKRSRRIVCRQIGSSFLTVFGVLVEKPVALPREGALRLGLAGLVLYSTSLSMSYSSALSAFAAEPPSQIYTTLGQLTEAGIPLKMPKNVRELAENSTSEALKHLLKTSIPSDSEIKPALHHTGTGFALLEKSSAVRYLNPYGMYSIHPPVHTIINALALPKGNPYYGRLQHFVTISFEAGLILKWESDTNKCLPARRADIQRGRVLTLHNLQIMFYLLLVGYSFSAISFGAEIGLGALYRCKTKCPDSLGPRIRAKRGITLRFN